MKQKVTQGLSEKNSESMRKGKVHKSLKTEKGRLKKKKIPKLRCTPLKPALHTAESRRQRAARPGKARGGVVNCLSSSVLRWLTPASRIPSCSLDTAGQPGC